MVDSPLAMQEIVAMLQDNGDLVTAQQAQGKLPDEVDTEAHGELPRGRHRYRVPVEQALRASVARHRELPRRTGRL